MTLQSAAAARVRSSSMMTAVVTRSKALKRRLVRVLSRVGGTPGLVGPASSEPGATPVQLTERGSRRDLALPPGTTRDEVHELLATISIDGAPPQEISAYLTQDFERFLLTWALVRDDTGRALEIGANPYFATVLLREFTDLQVTLTNSFLPDATGVTSQKVSYQGAASAAPEVHDFEYHNLNVETSTFPFDDASFDVVIFCEVIEHLLIDPLVALAEIKRVLKPGGKLVLSTPNVARLENVARLAAGANLYDPYSGYGPYGRHNREFTRHEIVRLLQFAGFDVTDHFTADVHEHQAQAFADVAKLAPLVAGRLEDLGQYLFCTATSSGSEARKGRPSELFRSFNGESLVSWD